MSKLATAPPYSPIEPVTEVLHGVTVTDPYRWLEDQDSLRTREWLRAQHEYARSYLEAIPGRDRIRRRIRELLDVETCDSIQKAGQRYFFRKRLAGQEQPCIYFREGAEGADHLLIDPAERGTGPYTAVKPQRVSPDGRLLLYEVKEGGERTGTFEILEIETRTTLPDLLPPGHLRGFAFAPDGRSFCYVHEEVEAKRPCYRAAYQHTLGTAYSEDREIFFAGEGRTIRLALFGDESFLVFFVYRSEENTFTEVYAKPFHSGHAPELLWAGTTQLLGLHFLGDRILALTDSGAPNRRIIETRDWHAGKAKWTAVISETDTRIESWWVVGNEIFVCYAKPANCQVHVFDLSGRKMDEIPLPSEETVRVISVPDGGGEILVEIQSFTKPAAILKYDVNSKDLNEFARITVPFESASYAQSQVWFTSKDGTTIPMYLVGRRDVLNQSSNPTVMTAYGGYGASMTPRFSIFVAFLLERGCLFAMPSIRGGSEFGHAWHVVARRHGRQTAYDDFLSAAEWLISTERTLPGHLAIFGGSNAGLLVAAAMTQRPDLFRAVVCMSPVADMLRYHLFDDAHVWRDEFGIADDPEDFAALASYSPYHRILEGAAYPATMIVAGDADGNCNPLHARKMAARLQASNSSDRVIFLDYHGRRGHSAVLPLSHRIEALTDRMAFLCDQLQLPV
jgi:prolyl oligopeptidase